MREQWCGCDGEGMAHIPGSIGFRCESGASKDARIAALGSEIESQKRIAAEWSSKAAELHNELFALKREPDDEAVREAMAWADGAVVSIDQVPFDVVRFERTQAKVLAASCRKAWAEIDRLRKVRKTIEDARDANFDRAEEAERALSDARRDHATGKTVFAGREQEARFLQKKAEARVKGLENERDNERYRANENAGLYSGEKTLREMDRAEVERLRAALERMVSPETDWSNGAVGVGHIFRAIAYEALSPKPCAECDGTGSVYRNPALLFKSPCSKCHPPKPDEGKP